MPGNLQLDPLQLATPKKGDSVLIYQGQVFQVKGVFRLLTSAPSSSCNSPRFSASIRLLNVKTTSEGSVVKGSSWPGLDCPIDPFLTRREEAVNLDEVIGAGTASLKANNGDSREQRSGTCRHTDAQHPGCRHFNNAFRINEEDGSLTAKPVV